MLQAGDCIRPKAFSPKADVLHFLQNALNSLNILHLIKSII